MIDSRGTLRGFCLTCGQSECESYEPKNADENTCNYCGCPPTKHQRLEQVIATEDFEDHQDAVNVSTTRSTTPSTSTGSINIPRKLNFRKGVKILTKRPTGSKLSTNAVSTPYSIF